MKFKFYKCAVCGQIIMVVEETASPVICCGKTMEEMVPGSVDADKEKHVPILDIKDRHAYVQIGETEHPMTPEHHISWSAMRTGNSITIRELIPGSHPHVCFTLGDTDKVSEILAYCNRHGLWKCDGEGTDRNDSADEC